MDKLQGQIAEVSQEFGIGSESRSFVFGQPDQPVKGHDQVMGSDSSAQVCLFGSVPASGITPRCDRSLPGLSTFKDRESACGTHGARPTLAMNLTLVNILLENIN
jgi:hypothetical protein